MLIPLSGVKKSKKIWGELFQRVSYFVKTGPSWYHKSMIPAQHF